MNKFFSAPRVGSASMTLSAAKSFEFLSLNEDSAVTDLDFSDGSESPPDYEEVSQRTAGCSSSKRAKLK